METVRYTKLALRKLRGEYQRALTAETHAIKNNVSLEKAWWYAANTDFYLNRLRRAEAGLPLPAPRTAKNKARSGLQCLAIIGKIIKKAFQVKAALVRAKAKTAALQAAKKARHALRNVLRTVARLVVTTLTPAKEETMNDTTLSMFRSLADAMRGGESDDWQWIGPHMSQRMFGITERRAKEYAARHGGEARKMDR